MSYRDLCHVDYDADEWPQHAACWRIQLADVCSEGRTYKIIFGSSCELCGTFVPTRPGWTMLCETMYRLLSPITEAHVPRS